MVRFAKRAARWQRERELVAVFLLALAGMVSLPSILCSQAPMLPPSTSFQGVSGGFTGNELSPPGLRLIGNSSFPATSPNAAFTIHRLPPTEKQEARSADEDDSTSTRPADDPRANSTITDTASDTNSKRNTDEPIGDAPEDISESFLRQSTVLLAPGEGQIDYGFLYTWQETRRSVVLSNNGLGTEMLRDRQLVAPLNIRYGIMERTIVFAQLPVGYAVYERADPEQDNVTSRLGTGDLVAGFRYLWREETSCSPDVITSASIGAPVGNHQFHRGDAAAIGSGFWSANVGLNFVKSYDPIVLYSGFGYTHFFENEHLGQDLQPGELFNYSFGLGFAVNDSIVLSGEFVGGVQTYFYVNEQRLPSSWTEPFSLRFAVTKVVCKDRFIEPYLILGMNTDAPDIQFGVFHTIGF